MFLPACSTNAKTGYFSIWECSEEGGYEAGHSNYKASVAEILIKEGLDTLANLK